MLRQLGERLDRLIVICAGILATSPTATSEDKTRVLTLAGLSSQEIGAVIGIHPVSVRRLRSGSKQRNK